jgi:putative ABC transport system permease protein
MKPSHYWVFKALLSHYWRHPWQTLFLLLGLIAGVGLWSAVQIVNQHAENSYAQATSLLGAQASYWIRSKSKQGITQARYIGLRRAGFRQVFPLVEGQVSTPQGVPVSIIATDLFALPRDLLGQSEIDTGTKGASEWLEFIQVPYRAWVPEPIASELELQTGDRLVLRDGRKLPPALIQSRVQQGRRVLMDIGAAFELLNTERFSYLAVGEITPARMAELRKLLPDELELVENQQHLDLSELTESLHTHLTAMSLLSFAVGLFIVFNAVRFSLWYRRETFLNLRLMGVSVSILVNAILAETLIWSLIGAASGLVTGLALGQWLIPGLSASIHSLYGASVDALLSLHAETMFKAWAITLLGLLLALAWPLYQQLKHEVLAAYSPDTGQESERKARTNLLKGAIILSLIAAILYPQLDSAVDGFVLLGLVLFAAAWTLPGLLILGLHLARRLLGDDHIVGRWLVSDGWSQLPALRSAMMALLLALTANMGVGTLIDSFRGAFIGWLEIRQSADIYFQAERIDRTALFEPDSSRAWLRDSHARIGVTIRWRNRPTLLRGADTRAPDSLNLPLAQWLGERPDDALEMWRTQPDAILANEQAHYLGGLQLGEIVQFQTDEGTRDYRVVGFFYDYGNPYFHFYLSYEELAARWKHAYSNWVALWLKPDSKGENSSLEMAETSLRKSGAQPGDWISQVEIRKLSVNIFERTFAITAAMNALTLIVAGIALLASLLAILQERLPQFAQWRALGVRRREQMLVIACPLLIFIGITWLLAIPLGALLSWLLIHKLNIVSFGWSMPMLWEMGPAWRLGLLVLLVVGFTLMLIVWQLRRRLPEALAKLGDLA